MFRIGSIASGMGMHLHGLVAAGGVSSWAIECDIAVRHGAFWDITPPQTRTMGWYEALADLIPTLPETQLAPWQKAKFPELDKTCLVPDHSNWTTLTPTNKPALTVRAGHATFKALIKRVGGGRESDRIYHPEEPAFTIRAFGRNCDGHSMPGTAIADSKVVAVTPRACLRFFGDKATADKIWLPSGKALAQEVVGNGASWTMFQMLIDHIGVFSLESIKCSNFA